LFREERLDKVGVPGVHVRSGPVIYMSVVLFSLLSTSRSSSSSEREGEGKKCQELAMEKDLPSSEPDFPRRPSAKRYKRRNGDLLLDK
jgi:hypothetical protein